MAIPMLMLLQSSLFREFFAIIELRQLLALVNSHEIRFSRPEGTARYDSRDKKNRFNELHNKIHSYGFILLHHKILNN